MRIFLSILFFPLFSFSQNLVINGSFENYDSCPNTYSQIYRAVPWFQPCIFCGGTTSDFYNACANLSSPIDVPQNWMGFQYAYIGNGYAGIFVLYEGNGREYITGVLTAILQNDKKYCVEFYVNLADSSHWAIKDLGLYLSQDSIIDSSGGFPLTNFTPQIINPTNNFLDDTVSWMKIRGVYVAIGGEKFITIGNFKDNASTNAIGTTLDSSAYYYIDDVSVTECIDTCQPPSAKYNYTTDTLTATFNNMSGAGATNWFWYFGDGTSDTAQFPVHTYDSAGTYKVTFVACNQTGCCNEFCCDTITGSVMVNSVSINEIKRINKVSRIYPNPNDGKMQLDYKLRKGVRGELVIFDLTGRMVKRLILNNEHSILQLDAPELTEGMYLYNILVGDEIIISDKLIIIK